MFQAPPPKKLGLAELKRIMPRCPEKTARAALPHLVAAMAEARITGPNRCAAFLGQLAHESGELRFMEELSDGMAYEGREDLGNVEPGDGPRFKGRGPIQLTGRANYAACGNALGLNLLCDPKLVATFAVGFRAAGWFWTTRDLNTLADNQRWNEITRRINGGLSGAGKRLQYILRGLQVLGDWSPPNA